MIKRKSQSFRRYPKEADPTAPYQLFSQENKLEETSGKYNNYVKLNEVKHLFD